MKKDLHDFELSPIKVKVMIEKKERQEIKGLTKKEKIEYYMDKLSIQKEKKGIVDDEIKRITSKLEPIYDGILK